MKELWNNITKWFKSDTHVLVILPLFLIAMGTVAIYAIAPYHHLDIFGRYLPFLGVSVVLLFACSYLSKKWVIRICSALGIIGMLFILKTIIAPTIIAGSARYIQIGNAYIDVYLFNLPAYIVLMSHWLSKKLTKPKLSVLGISLLTLFIVCTAFRAPYIFMVQVYSFMFILLTFKARKNIPELSKAYIIALLMLVIMVAFAVLTLPHVQSRLLTEFYAGQYTALWYVKNMVINSQFIGTNSTALNYLSNVPNSLSDYMLYSIGAKFGIVALLAVLLAECGLILNLSRKAIANKDNFVKMVLIGTITLLSIGVFAQLLAPMVSSIHWYLPFVSFGGTALFVFCMLIGFVVALTRKSKNTN